MPKYRSRILVEECRILDVYRLDRTLTPGVAGVRVSNGETIELAWTACNFGGERPWFLCPYCFGHCAKLLDYRNNGLRCRRCYGASYAVENDTLEWRFRRRAEKLGKRLADGLDRPKGMHRHTYQRLYNAIAELEMAADGLFVQKVMRRWPDLLVS